MRKVTDHRAEGIGCKTDKTGADDVEISRFLMESTDVKNGRMEKKPDVW